MFQPFVYIPQCGLYDSQKGHFYDNLISVTNNFGTKAVVVVAGYCKGYVEGSEKDYQYQHES